MRALLLLPFVLAACAAPATDAPATVEMNDPEPVIDPRMDARYGLLAEALVGDWAIVTGPAETVTFSDDQAVSFFANDRLMDSGEWDVEEGSLFVLPAAGGQDTYTIEERRETGMTFTSATGPLVLERIRP